MRVIITADIHYGVGNNQKIVRKFAKKLCGISDEKFTQKVNQKLKKHLAKVSKQVRSIVCVTHCVPFSQLLRSNAISIDKFFSAFSGSIETGEIILKFPKVKYVLCGHTHEKKQVQIGNITAINVGSDYLRKRHELIEI